MAIQGKLWANSGDSHYMEPPDLYDRLPAHLRELMPKTVRDEEKGIETITVDGQSFERPIPRPVTPETLRRNAARPLDEDLDEVDQASESNIFMRAPGAFDPVKRLEDLGGEGNW